MKINVDDILVTVCGGFVGAIVYFAVKRATSDSMESILESTHRTSANNWKSFLKLLDAKDVDYDFIGKDSERQGCYMFEFKRHNSEDGKKVILSMSSEAAKSSEELSKVYIHILEELF